MERHCGLVLVLTMIGFSASATATARENDDGTKKENPSISAQFAAIRAEYETAQQKAAAESEKGKTEFESWKIYGKLMPSEVAFSRRMVNLAETAPNDPGARDALLWVLDKPGMGGGGPYGDEFVRAALLLLRHHADDPDVARIGLQLDNVFTPGRDLFLEGLYVQARNRETKGMATLALAQYLEVKSRFAAAVRKGAASGQLKDAMRIQTYDDNGKMTEKEIKLPLEDLAYRHQVLLSDPEAMRAEAKRLLEEVIKDHGDVPFVTRRIRSLQELLKQPNPTWNGQPLKPEDRQRAESLLAHKQSLADVARAKLDELENIQVGKPAPAIDGMGMDGKPLKLSDYKGKVVVLVFWGTWCGPCMAQVPHEREMAKRYQDRPFAILGIDCDSDKSAALKVMKKEGITWPNWNDGDPGEGPIVKSYHVKGFPTIIVLDEHGTIRQKDVIGSSLDKAVDELLANLEKKHVAKTQ